MVDEILKVYAQLLGPEQQNTSAALKRQMWNKIENRVNAIGNHPRTSSEIRKRWHDLKTKVRSLASRRHLLATGTGGGSPDNIFMAPWEEKVLGILPEESLYGIEDGVESGMYNNQHVCESEAR